MYVWSVGEPAEGGSISARGLGCECAEIQRVYLFARWQSCTTHYLAALRTNCGRQGRHPYSHACGAIAGKLGTSAAVNAVPVPKAQMMGKQVRVGLQGTLRLWGRLPTYCYTAA